MCEIIPLCGQAAATFAALPIPETILGMPRELVSVSAILSGSGSVVLGKLMSKAGAVTMPINYGALFVGALAGNWFLGDLHLPVSTSLQSTMVFALAGMTIAALTMMYFFQEE